VIRLSLLWLFVAFLSVYAWRDWYKALCGLILLMAIVQHPDFPNSTAGIQGLNPWNVLLFAIVLAWLSSRAREHLVWDMPKNINWYLAIYIAVIVLSVVRALGHMDEIAAWQSRLATYDVTFASLLSEYIINCVKWIVPGLLLFHGCNSEKRFKLALFSLLGVYVLLAVQVIRWMPLASITGGEMMADRSLKLLSNEIGFHRVNLSMLLAGASWAIFSVRGLVTSKTLRMAVLFICGMVFFAQALTGGRMGYVTWLAIAMLFGTLKWRKMLVIGPVVVAALVMLVPAVKERLLEGFTPDTYGENRRIESHQYREGDGPDLYTVTSGRTFAWPFVFEKISEAPLVGHGREAMITTGLATFLLVEYGEGFPHPHNAYLQFLLDNGFLGTIPILLFFWVIFKYSTYLFRQKSCNECVAIGGVCLALVAALLIAGMGSQTFYPREGAVGMWCAIGLMLRVYVLFTSADRRPKPESEVAQSGLWNGRRVDRA